jgi:hypothetical protein
MHFPVRDHQNKQFAIIAYQTRAGNSLGVAEKVAEADEGNGGWSMAVRAIGT